MQRIALEKRAAHRIRQHRTHGRFPDPDTPITTTMVAILLHRPCAKNKPFHGQCESFFGIGRRHLFRRVLHAALALAMAMLTPLRLNMSTSFGMSPM